MKPPIAYRARYIFPVSGQPLAGGVLTVAAGRISALSASPASNIEVQDLGNVAIVPGLVNAHTHLEFSDLGQPLGTKGMSLADWIPLVVRHRRERTFSDDECIERGLRECATHQTAAVGEISTSERLAVYDSAPLDLTVFCESIALNSDRIAGAEAAVVARLDQANAASNWHAAVSPHAPYTVHPELFARLVELARRRSLPLAVHLAESREELEFLASESGPLADMLAAVPGFFTPGTIPPNTRPLDYLHLLAPASRVLVVHGNYLKSDEIAYIADRRKSMSVVYCPRTHHYFGHSAYPLSEMLAAGIEVALGTDSRASNPDLNLWEEMRHVAQHHPGVRLSRVLELGTLAGARALGIADRFGSLTPGKHASLAIIPLPSHNAADPHELLFPPAR